MQAELKPVPIRLFSPAEPKRRKAAERAADRAAARAGRAKERQERNRFVPNARGWQIGAVPDPQRGEKLD
jgi:hypothetical protein